MIVLRRTGLRGAGTDARGQQGMIEAKQTRSAWSAAAIALIAAFPLWLGSAPAEAQQRTGKPPGVSVVPPQDAAGSSSEIPMEAATARAELFITGSSTMAVHMNTVVTALREHYPIIPAP